MHKLNIGMTLSSIKALNIQSGDNIIEIGHGNCSHLDTILNTGDDISYTGIEISETMMNEAIRINKAVTLSHNINFQLYDGNKIPFPSLNFSTLFSVNSIYFWEDANSLLNEFYRILSIDDICVITFA